MAAVTCWISGVPKQIIASSPIATTRAVVAPASGVVKASLKEENAAEDCVERRSFLAGVGVLASSLALALPRITAAEEAPDRFKAFVDFIDGYSYYHPSDWRVIPDLVKNVYAAPTQNPTIFNMEEGDITHWSWEPTSGDGDVSEISSRP